MIRFVKTRCGREGAVRANWRLARNLSHKVACEILFPLFRKKDERELKSQASQLAQRKKLNSHLRFVSHWLDQMFRNILFSDPHTFVYSDKHLPLLPGCPLTPE